MIDIIDVTLAYPRARRSALREMSAQIPRGKFTAVVGPNGSGKSTLVRALLGRLRPVSGRVLIDGENIEAVSRRAIARKLAVVPQREENVFPLRVDEYVAMGRLPFQSPWRGQSAVDAAAVRKALDRAGMSTFADRSTDELSGGEWQRARIARALAQDGQAIVLDEPTTFLDIAHQMAVFELARSLAQEGRAVLVVSHEINLVARFADSMLLLHEGVLVASGPPDEVMRADLLERVYEWPLVVARDPAAGTPLLIPLRVPK